MKNIIITVAFALGISFTSLAQANRTATPTKVAVSETSQSLRVEGAEGHYCDYCKGNYAQSHFPCIMKAIKGKINAKTGMVEFVAGEPIGGIVVKGGKNPGGNLNLLTNANGEIEINNAAPGNYQLIIALPTNTGDAQSRVAGSPIGGIVVKGGKNPGGGMMQMITNTNGEVNLNITEAGNYKFTLTAPTTEQKNNPLYQSSQAEHVNPLYKGNQ
ncbi:hypothetical protein [Pedobacter sp. Hv1]|uniref:hypothetical protein n=1 Tax=Pedobacter sp. Hv1 TaxID=1740090 RepID=UPI0006D8D6BE|nr:hypothetical protein [Pedobacter sp. Hv1]KQC00491.1 hypothetical protein AQF98_13535 [Pedobacter sp. Hv1]